MAKWIEYTGSDEQIREIFSANDVLFRVKYRPDRFKSSIFNSDLPISLMHIKQSQVASVQGKNCPIYEGRKE